MFRGWRITFPQSVVIVSVSAVSPVVIDVSVESGAEDVEVGGSRHVSSLQDPRAFSTATIVYAASQTVTSNTHSRRMPIPKARSNPRAVTKHLAAKVQTPALRVPSKS